MNIMKSLRSVFQKSTELAVAPQTQPHTKPLFQGPTVQDRNLLMLGVSLNKSVINSYIFMAQQGDTRRFSALKREMLSDPFLSGECNKIKSKLISSPITFGTFPTNLDKPKFANTSDSHRAHMITDYCKAQLLDSSDLLRQAISDIWYGLLDGVAVLEIICEVQNGNVVLKELVTLPQERISYLPGTTTLGVQLTDDVSKLTPLDKLDGNFIVFVANGSDPNPARRGLLRKCISPWFTSRYLNEWWSRATELNGQPTRVAYYNPSDAEMKVELEQLLASAGSATYMVLPEGTKIDFINSITAANTTLYSDLLDASHEQISVALLGATQTTSIKPNSGSRASSTIHYEVSNNTVNGYGLAICAAIRDQLISRLVEWQFSEEDAKRFTPTMTIKVLGYEDLEKLAGTLPVFAAAGLPISNSYVYDVSGIPVPDPSEPMLKAVKITDNPSQSPVVDTPSPGQLLSNEKFSTDIEKQVGELLIKPYVDHAQKIIDDGGDLKRVLSSLHLFARSRGEDKAKAEKIVSAYVVDAFHKGHNHAAVGH